MIVFCFFCDSITNTCFPKITKFVSPLYEMFFVRGIKAGNPEQARWAISPDRVANQNTGFTFCCKVQDTLQNLCN